MGLVRPEPCDSTESLPGIIIIKLWKKCGGYCLKLSPKTVLKYRNCFKTFY